MYFLLLFVCLFFSFLNKMRVLHEGASQSTSLDQEPSLILLIILNCHNYFLDEENSTLGINWKVEACLVRLLK